MTTTMPSTLPTARPDDEGIRDEFQGYKQDIADGNLRPADVRYLHTLKNPISVMHVTRHASRRLK